MHFYKLSNKSGKRWIIPDRHILTALELYQPSGINGKLIKKLLPFILLIDVLDIVKRLLHIESVCNPIKTLVRTELETIFNATNLEYSVFLGTPCAHQKTTIQIFVGKKILGYCKISTNPDVGKLFENEARTMQRLADCGVTNVPQCLLCKKLSTGEWIFVQTTTKSLYSKVLHEWSNLHDNFLYSLYKATKDTMPYEDTDLYKSMDYLQRNIVSIDKQENKTIAQIALDRIAHEYSKRLLDVCAFHSDFTPWNMFEEQGHLFVFDWEYASFSYPPYLDRIHFFMQTAIYEKKWDVRQIIREYRKIELFGFDSDLMMTTYLLNILSFYIRRGGGRLEVGLEPIAEIWFKLLKNINEKID